VSTPAFSGVNAGPEDDELDDEDEDEDDVDVLLSLEHAAVKTSNERVRAAMTLRTTGSSSRAAPTRRDNGMVVVTEAR
jgi:hypothetical protein